MTAPLLSTHGVRKAFGGIAAVADVSLAIGAGELVGLIGPNGSGKTTLLNLITGFYPPEHGQVRLGAVDIAGRSPDRIFRAGIARMFQQVRVFRRLTASENLEVAGRCAGLAAEEARRRALAVLDRLGLAAHAGHEAGALSGGQQRLVEFGGCFVSAPRLVVLDEPFAAIHPTVKQVMVDVITERHAGGQAFLVVSHDIPAIMRLCPRTVCMNAGTVIADGATEGVMADRRVVEAYLGGHGR
ncbi:MAG: ABC transporter ATP-binding protein [Candidatus Rokuibacteriota bacterium]